MALIPVNFIIIFVSTFHQVELFIKQESLGICRCHHHVNSHIIFPPLNIILNLRRLKVDCQYSLALTIDVSQAGRNFYHNHKETLCDEKPIERQFLFLLSYEDGFFLQIYKPPIHPLFHTYE